MKLSKAASYTLNNIIRIEKAIKEKIPIIETIFVKLIHKTKDKP